MGLLGGKGKGGEGMRRGWGREGKWRCRRGEGIGRGQEERVKGLIKEGRRKRGVRNGRGQGGEKRRGQGGEGRGGEVEVLRRRGKREGSGGESKERGQKMEGLGREGENKGSGRGQEGKGWKERKGMGRKG